MKVVNTEHTKVCTRCGVEKSIDDFNWCGSLRRRPDCKMCLSRYRSIRAGEIRALRLAELANRTEKEELERLCNRCGEVKPINCFAYRSSTETTRRHTCVRCTSEQRKLRLGKSSTLTEISDSPRSCCFKINPEDVERIKAETLAATRDKRKPSAWPDDPIEQSKLLYHKAWSRICSVG